MKTLLSVSTALVSAAYVTLADPVPARETAFGHLETDANREFLCNYGFTIYTNGFASSFGGGETWVRAAVPVWGKGETISAVVVRDAATASGFGGSTTAGFTVGIYSTHNRKPDQELSWGNANQPKKCQRVKVPITPISLEKGKEYWIVETADFPPLSSSIHGEGKNLISWIYGRNRAKSGGLSQYGYTDWTYSCEHNHSIHCDYKSHWKPITGGVPYARLVIQQQARDGGAARAGRILEDNGTSNPPDAKSGDSVLSEPPATQNHDPP